MISANKAGNEDFINTWSVPPFEERSRPSYTQITTNALSTADQQNAITNLAACTQTLLAAIQRQADNLRLWLGAEAHLSQLSATVQGLFKNDEWINQEYMGLNGYFAGLSFAEVLALFEEALQMSCLTGALVIGKLRAAVEAADQVGVALPMTTSRTRVNDQSEALEETYKRLDRDLRQPGAPIKPSVDDAYRDKIFEYLRQMSDQARGKRW